MVMRLLTLKLDMLENVVNTGHICRSIYLIQLPMFHTKKIWLFIILFYCKKSIKFLHKMKVKRTNS